MSYTDSGKTHYVVFKVTLGLNKKAKDYSTKSTSINNGMKLIVSQITNEALKYSYNTVTLIRQQLRKICCLHYRISLRQKQSVQ